MPAMRVRSYEARAESHPVLCAMLWWYDNRQIPTSLEVQTMTQNRRKRALSGAEGLGVSR